MNITVFGSARPNPEDPIYIEARELGALLGNAGYTVITGGYGGTMEAVSRGASETGAHVIGVTCEEIEHWQNTSVNPWVKEEIREKTLTDRMLTMMDMGDAFVALPGGVGTFSEVILLWNRLVIDAISKKPIFMIGIEWKLVFEQFFEKMKHFFSEKDKDHLEFIEDIRAIQPLLKKYSL